MISELELTEALSNVLTSRWVINPAKFKALVHARGLRLLDLAVAMGYGNGGRVPENAASHLSDRLRGGAVKPRPILDAANKLGVSPFDFALPVRARNMDALPRDVEIVLCRPKVSKLVQYLQLALDQAALSVGLDCSLEFETALLDLLTREVTDSGKTGAIGISRRCDAVLERFLSKNQMFDVYFAIMKHEIRHGSLNKRAVDLTGTMSEFKSWDTPVLRRLIELDSAFLERESSTLERSICRAFVVNRSKITEQGLCRLEETFHDQVNRGIGVSVKYWEEPMLDLEYMGDIAVIGDWALDFGVLEVDQTARIPFREMFIHSSETFRFEKMKKRLEWVSDLSAVDVTFTRKEEIDEIATDIRSSIKLHSNLDKCEKANDTIDSSSALRRVTIS